MIRILHIVSSLSIGSGVMSVLMSYYRALDRKKFQFDYLFFRKADKTYEQEIRALGGRVYRCSRPTCRKGFFDEIEHFFDTHSGEYEILHCHPIYTSAIFAPAAKRYGVLHVIQHSHTTERSENFLHGLRNLVIQLLFGRYATDYAACSEAAKRILFWVSPDRIFLMRNAIDTNRFRFSEKARRQIRQGLNIPEEAFVIGHIGRFVPLKNHMFLLDIYAAVRKWDPNAWLLLIGEGGLMEDVKQKAEALGISDRVRFIGHTAHVADYMSAMDYFLLPSTSEGLPVVLVEAQTSGLPCAASTNVPEEAKISDSILFLPLEDGAEAWAARILKLRRSPGERAPQRLCLRPDFEIHAAARLLEQYYASLAQPDRTVSA